MLVNERLTEANIKRLVEKHPDFSEQLIIRDTESRLLQLRFHKCGFVASWRVLFKNKWLKVGCWPELSVGSIRKNLAQIMSDVRQRNKPIVVTDELLLCGDVFKWYLTRLEDNNYIAGQTKKDVKSAIKCHLLPLIGSESVVELTKDSVDRLLVWPLQKELALSSVKKVFHILKRVLRDAYSLQRIKVNPLVEAKISDFNLTNSTVKKTNLKIHHLPEMLGNLYNYRALDVNTLLRVLVVTLLTLGTRIGETLKIKWHDIGFKAPCLLDIPAQNTKTKKPHVIYLPVMFVDFLAAWRKFLLKKNYAGVYVFPNKQFTGVLGYNDAASMINEFSKGEWSAHDLRRCARSCWAKQKVDFMVAERMLNHSLGKVTEAYLNEDVAELSLVALKNHVNWLREQNIYCFFLNPEPTPSMNDDSYIASKNRA